MTGDESRSATKDEIVKTVVGSCVAAPLYPEIATSGLLRGDARFVRSSHKHAEGY